MDKVVLSNFSAGVTSTVATKLALDKYGKENVRILFFETGQHHPDNERYMKECEEWFGKHIEVFHNKKFSDAYDVVEKTKYVNGPSGARCTGELKKKVRQKLEPFIDFSAQVFGFEYQKKEMNRGLRFQQQYPEARAEFPLIEKRLTKADCFAMLKDVGIKAPAMYDLGYHNNNCIGCIKGGMGYWNKIRVDFPEYFDRMAKIEREIGNSCIKGTFLDELDPERGRHSDMSFECGAFCQVEMSGLKVYDDLEELRSKLIGSSDE